MKVDDRISELEKKIKPLDLSETKIDWNCLSPEEQKLLERVFSLRKNFLSGLLNDEETDEYMLLMTKSTDYLRIRVTLMFREMMRCFCRIISNDNPMIDIVLYSRFMWFMNEMIRHAAQLGQEKRLWEQYEDFEDFERAYEKYRETLEDKTRLWSVESFNRDLDRIFRRTREAENSKSE